MKSEACQYRATLQICNEKALAKGVARAYIVSMEIKIIRLGNALYLQVNGLLTNFLGMV